MSVKPSFFPSVALPHIEVTTLDKYIDVVASAQTTILKVANKDVPRLVYQNASAVQVIVLVHFPKISLMNIFI